MPDDMTSAAPPPRIAPAAEPFAPEVAATLAGMMPPGQPPLGLFLTWARNPRVLARMKAGSLLDRGLLSLRQREIVIDRTTARLGAEYEWGVHVAFFAARAGLSDAQVRASALGAADDPVWSPPEQALLLAVDELCETATWSDACFARLKAHFTDEQILELLALVGFYHSASFFANALCIAPESFAARFPAA